MVTFTARADSFTDAANNRMTAAAAEIIEMTGFWITHAIPLCVGFMLGGRLTSRIEHEKLPLR